MAAEAYADDEPVEIGEYDPVGPDPDFGYVYADRFRDEDVVYEDPGYEPDSEDILFSSTGGVLLLFLAVAVSLCILANAWRTGGTLVGFEVGRLEFYALLAVLVFLPILLAYENVALAIVAGIAGSAYIGMSDPEYLAVTAVLIASGVFYLADWRSCRRIHLRRSICDATC